MGSTLTYGERRRRRAVDDRMLRALADERRRRGDVDGRMLRALGLTPVGLTTAELAKFLNLSRDYVAARAALLHAAGLIDRTIVNQNIGRPPQYSIWKAKSEPTSDE